MNRKWIVVVLLINIWSVYIPLSASAYDYSFPEHVHLSYGDSDLQMVVTWTTYNKTLSIVEYGTNKLSSIAKGAVTTFFDKGDTNRTWYIHRVTLQNLKPGVKYYYHCGSDEGWSSLYYFTGRRPDPDWAPWIAMYGDMGGENGQSIPRLQQEVARNTIDIVMHVGDLAYNLDSDNGRVGDLFMERIEPIAAYIPYMTTVGNHEDAMNFTHYKQRFSMPGNSQGMFYSYNVGRAHVISISTEVYYYTKRYGSAQIKTQYNWLVKDLQNANKQENRQERPWIIVLGHRPMYCGINYTDDCVLVNDKVRLSLEQLFYDQGVDVEVWAHEHEWERMYPLYNYTICNGSVEEPYKNPRAPVHIITGSAGCKERHDIFLPKPDWIAVNNKDYGYTRMKVINSTHLYMEQVSDDKHGAIVDSVMIESHKHGAGMFTCHKDRQSKPVSYR